MEEYLAKLKPVSEWTWNLYRVQFWYDEEETQPYGKPQALVSTDCHISEEVQHIWPSDRAEYATWEVVKEDVPRPKIIGNMYGHPISEGARAAGLRYTILA